MYKFLLVAGMAFAMTSLQAQTSTAASNTQPSNTQTTAAQNSNSQTTNGQNLNNQASNNQQTSNPANSTQASNSQANSNPNNQATNNSAANNQTANNQAANNEANNNGTNNQASNTQPNQNSNNKAFNNNAQSANSNMQNSKEQLSNDVATVLQDTQHARRALWHQNKQQAMTDVDNALHAVKQLNQASNNAWFVPLYTELGEYSAIGPFNTPTTVSHNPNGQNWNSNSGNSANNQQNQNQQEMNNLAAKRVVGQYTSICLDTRAAESNLRAAKDALNSGNLSEAKSDLSAVQNSVMAETVESDMPLLRARENLIIARMAARQGNFAQVHTSLQAAARALNTYEQQGGQHATEAQHLQSKITQYDQNLAQNHSNASARIQAFWNKTTNLVTPAQDQNQTQSAYNHPKAMQNGQYSSNKANSNNQSNNQ